MLQDVHTTPRGGEEYVVFHHRVNEAMDGLPETEGNLAVVTHGGVVRLIFREILGMG